MGINKAILLGRLGKDPELRYTSQQTPVCNFSLATGDRRKDASGNWVDHTEWHNVIAFGKTAENCANYLKKGREVFVEGRIQTRKWQDRDGKDRYTTEILASTIQFVGGRDAASGSMSASSERTESPSSPDVLEGLTPADAIGGAGNDNVSFDDDDIPF